MQARNGARYLCRKPLRSPREEFAWRRFITVLMAAPGDQPAGELLSGYRDLVFVPKPVRFTDLAEKLELLLGIPATPTKPLRSMDRTRSRGRRTSGHHQV